MQLSVPRDNIFTAEPYNGNFMRFLIIKSQACTASEKEKNRV